MESEYIDVCVFGGGPAGSTVAKKLALFGYSVMLVEKETFPRFHIGLSLTPGIHHWLQLLNLKGAVDAAGFTRACTSRILWESNNTIEKNFVNREAGYHVDRGQFDQILLTSAVSEGVRLYQPYTLKKLSLNRNGRWEIVIEHQSVRQHISARFIVEATGRKSILKESREALNPQTLATYALWSGSSGNKEFSFVEAGKNHWYWGAPVPKSGYLACIFSDPAEIRKYKSVHKFYHNKIHESVLFPLDERHSTAGDISVCGAMAYRSHNVVSLNHIKVGDSAYSEDPLSAQGVQKAIKSAYHSAIVINTILSRPENSDYALQYYGEMIGREVARKTRWTTSLYNQQNIFSGGPFWKARQDQSLTEPIEIPGSQISLNKTDRLILNPEATIEPVPVVGDSYVENVKGILLEGHEDPFVFLENTALVPLISKLEKKSIREGMVLIKAYIPRSDPMRVLRWLVYNRIVCKKEQLR